MIYRLNRQPKYTKCPLCKKSIKNNHHLSMHFLRFHPEDKLIFNLYNHKCVVCGSKFKNIHDKCFTCSPECKYVWFLAKGSESNRVYYKNKYKICEFCKKRFKFEDKGKNRRYCSAGCVLRAACKKKHDNALIKAKLIKTCEMCGNIFEKHNNKYGRNIRFCSRSCSSKYTISKNGFTLKSRSKNEIKCYEYIKKYFKHEYVICDDTESFIGWSIDMTFPKYKIAIEWDGAPHFIPIWGDQALKNIIKKDKYKSIMIERAGWVLYRIKDDFPKNNNIVNTKINNLVEQLDCCIKRRKYEFTNRTSF